MTDAGVIKGDAGTTLLMTKTAADAATISKMIRLLS